MNDRYQHFDPGHRFWTPDWDAVHDQPRTVKAIKKPNGSWHKFDDLVSVAEADLLFTPRSDPARRPGESRQAFRNRARTEAKRNG